MDSLIRLKAPLAVVLLLLAAECNAIGGRIIFVDANAPGSNDGSSWTNAYNYLQDALTDANSAAKPLEIHVAQGIYKPDRGAGMVPGDRTATFQLINGVTLKGGFAGFGQPDPNARDIHFYETILSGDLNQDDVEVADPCDLLTEPTRAENSYHVVTGSGTDGTAVLDGFTIRGGNADGPWSIYGGPHDGGGMLNINGSPVIINCVFSENSAGAGGGIYNIYSNPTLTDCTFVRNWAGVGAGMDNFYLSSATLKGCTFKDNSADVGGGIADLVGSMLTNCKFTGNSAADSGGGIFSYGAPVLIGCTFIRNSAGYGGGAIYAYDAPTATITNCIFEENSAHWGGAIYNWEAGVKLINCVFTKNVAMYGGGISDSDGSFSALIGCSFVGNFAYESGGGAWSESSSLILTNCSLIGNSAGNEGGGLFHREWSHWDRMKLTNCTLAGNSAAKGNALAYDLGVQDSRVRENLTSFHIVANCILWDGGNEIWNNDESTIVITYSDVESGWPAAVYDPCNVIIWGYGNIDIDPCFADPGYWDPNGTAEDPNDDFWVDGDYHLLSGSPCIDAGDPNYIAEPNETDLDGKPRIIGGRIDMGAYEYRPPIQAYVRIVPRSINLVSSGKWIAAFIRLPEDYNVADIDPNSIFLENGIEPERFWLTEDQQIAITKFNRKDVQAIFDIGDVELTTTGRLTDGTTFEGTDVVKVIDKSGRKSSKKRNTSKRNWSM